MYSGPSWSIEVTPRSRIPSLISSSMTAKKKENESDGEKEGGKGLTRRKERKREGRTLDSFDDSSIFVGALIESEEM